MVVFDRALTPTEIVAHFNDGNSSIGFEISILAEVNPVPTPSNDTTPSYTFSSTKAGTITYGGSCCSTALTDAIAGNNTITYGTLTTLTAGTYGDCTVTVTDAAGNASVALTVTEFVIDTTLPAIILLGTTPVYVVQGNTYNDAGATALDDVDGNITGSIVTVNPVDTNTLGTYTVTYNVYDAAEVTRSVNVVANIIPIITLLLL